MTGGALYTLIFSDHVTIRQKGQKFEIVYYA